MFGVNAIRTKRTNRGTRRACGYGKLSGDKRGGNLARLETFANYRASTNAAILIRVRAVMLLMGQRVRNQFREWNSVAGIGEKAGSTEKNVKISRDKETTDFRVSSAIGRTCARDARSCASRQHGPRSKVDSFCIGCDIARSSWFFHITIFQWHKFRRGDR